MRPRHLLLLAALAACASAHAVSTSYSVAGPTAKAAMPAQLRAAPGTVPAARIHLPAPAAAALEKVRKANEGPSPKRLQVGIDRPVPQPAAPPAWQRIAEGWVSHWEVTSERAASLRVALRMQDLPAGAEVRVTDIAEETVYGPFDAAEVPPQAAFWTPVIEGDTARVEVFVAAAAPPEAARVRVQSVSHIYVSIASGKYEEATGQSGSCNEDLVCRSNADSALALAGRSVAGMTFSDGTGTYVCTGTLLNATDGLQVPYLYSAAHCINTPAEAGTLTTHWFFDRANCGSGGTSSGYVQRAGGADLLYANADSDVLLLRLKTAPPAGAVFSAWESAAVARGAALTGIHHPGGDWKKVSRGTADGVFDGLPAGYPQGSFTVVNWSTGVTEPGSSGSAVFSLDGGVYRVRGGLWGGSSSCSNPHADDYYSRFDQAFPALAGWLDPAPTPVDCTYTLSRGGISVAAAAESGTVTVTPSPSSCAWRASSAVPWVTLSGPGTGAAAATGSATFTYAIAANNSTAGREGTLTVAGINVPVLQSAAGMPPTDPACSFSLSPSVRSIDAGARAGTVTVSTTAGCRWVPLSDSPWLLTTGGGSASGSFTYAAQANSTGSARTATVTVGNKTFTLLQAQPGGAPPEPPGTPELTLMPGAIDFGGQSMGTTSRGRVLVLANTGAGALTLLSIARSGPQFGFSSNCVTLYAGDTCSILVTATPPAAPGPLNSTSAFAGALTLSSNAPGSPHRVGLGVTGEKSLVTHYYGAILRRAPDADGTAYWQGEAARLAAEGANVNETWYAMASFFFASPEYLALARDDEGFLADLYATFFNRAPDPGGLDYWSGLLAQGVPRGIVLVSFMLSPEFTGFAAGLFGDTRARAEIDTVGDFYRGLLARLPDSGGLAYWVQRFRAAQCAGSAAVYREVESISSGFLQSQEYASRNRTHAQFVGDLYNAFLRRGGDLSGAQYWIAQLSAGARSREQVRRAFIATPEFDARVRAVVAQGCLP